VYVRYWLAAAVVAIAVVLFVAMAPILATIARTLWVTTKRQLSIAGTILRGEKEGT